MPDVALFWAVLAGFLLVDNLVLLPAGGDHLRFGMRRRLRCDAGTRLEALRRDMVLLNPLNPFDRVAVTDRTIGELDPAALRTALRRVATSLAPLNRLSWIGVAYLVGWAVLAALSSRLPFGPVLLALAVLHLCAWAASAFVVLRSYPALHLTKGRAWSLLAEALFVPAYTVNLGKRAWYRHRLDIPALAYGLHALKRVRGEAEREQQAHRLSVRLDACAEQGDAGSHAFIHRARTCLRTSVPSIGS